MINISNLSFAHGNHLVLNKINLEIKHSEVVLVKGQNGIGKTTLLSCIANLLDPLEGSIEYLSKAVDNRIASKKFFFLGENNFAFENLSIIENINYWLNLNLIMLDKNLILKNISYLFGNIDIHKNYSDLSFGQKRKIKILLLMLINKPVWILDDPLNGLDEETIKKVNEIIQIKREKNGIIIIASHQNLYLENIKVFNLK